MAAPTVGRSSQPLEQPSKARLGLESLWGDIRFASRIFRRSPAVALTVIGTLAVALSLNATAYSFSIPTSSMGAVKVIQSRTPPSLSTSSTRLRKVRTSSRPKARLNAGGYSQISALSIGGSVGFRRHAGGPLRPSVDLDERTAQRECPAGLDVERTARLD